MLLYKSWALRLPVYYVSSYLEGWRDRPFETPATFYGRVNELELAQ